MTWNPTPTVTIGGVSFTGRALNGVTISMGRNSVWSQARAGYCSIDLVNLTNSHWNLQINDSVVVKIKNSLNVDVTLFTGKLRSTNSKVNATGSTANVVVQNVVAIGPMADMSRVLTGGTSWAKEYDDARLSRILTASGVTIDVVDTPGNYEFSAVTKDVSDCYSYAAYYANMGFGYIYETASGKVGYANESRRTVDVATNGYLSIPTNVILGRSVSSEKSFKDLLNNLRLIWKNGQIKTASNTASISAYGDAAATIETELEDGAQAEFQTQRYVAMRSQPQTNLNSFTIQLDSSTMTNTLRDNLLGVKLGTAIQISGLPTGILDGTFNGFVENHIFTINQNQAQLTILATDSTLSITPTRWQDVSASLIWSAVTPTLQWQNYE